MADREAAGLSPHAYDNTADPDAIDAARHRMALRIEALTGKTPPPIGTGGNGQSGDPSGSGSGSGGGSAPLPGNTVTARGSCSATYGRAPRVTSFSLALAGCAVLLILRRRSRSR
jgi:hypothetical protein